MQSRDLTPLFNPARPLAALTFVTRPEQTPLAVQSSRQAESA
jgi:hypothetical protein